MGITFDQIMEANEKMNAIDVKGKMYMEVNQRIKAFRMLYPNGSIQTSIQSLENGICVIKAFVFDEEKNLIGTGHAYEKEGSTFINKTSYIENCETSAVGRALGMCGIGIDTSVASYEEVSNAIAQQEDEKIKKALIDQPKKTVLINTAKKKGVELVQIFERYGISSIDEMNMETWTKAMNALNKMNDKQE